MGTFESEARRWTLLVIFLAYEAGFMTVGVTEHVLSYLPLVLSLKLGLFLLKGLEIAFVLGVGAVTTYLLWLLVQKVGKKLTEDFE